MSAVRPVLTDAPTAGPAARPTVPAVVPTPRSPGSPRPAVARWADLEGYRGLAALAVVLYHVFQYAEAGAPGRLGAHGSPTWLVLHGLDAFVDLFFVLSAFLLTVPYARRALAGGAAPSARAFVVRRAARIVPLYLVAVSLVWALRNPALPGDLVDLVEHLTFTQVLDDRRIFATIGPAWSLAVEVHFYVLLALLGAGACRLTARLAHRRRAAALYAGIGALVAAGVTWKVVAWYVLGVPETSWSTWFTLPAKLDVFGLGMLLGVLVAQGRVRTGRTSGAVLRGLGSVVVAAAFATRPQGAGDQVWFHTVAAVGFALVLAPSVLAVPDRRDRWVAALAAPVPAFLGVVSYSLYLWHEPLLLGLAGAGLVPAQTSPWAFGVTLAVLVPVSVLVAWVSYVLVERPMGALGRLVDRDGRSRDYYDGS